MKISLSIYAAALAALLAGPSMAGDPAKSDDAPRDLMHADKDGDGRVSRDEATAKGSTKSGDWFDKVDQNKDGYVTKDELNQARDMRHEHHDQMKEKAAGRFKDADANSDGQISLDEAQAKMPKVAENFSTLDADKNGVLSKQEFKKGAKQAKSKGKSKGKQQGKPQGKPEAPPPQS
jgi:Ca2+-binding EF-hand superfamily protein